MRCDDIIKALNSDNGNLDEVERHLKTCPDCAEKFGRNLEIEQALRNLKFDPVNIADDVKNALYISNKHRLKCNFIRKWVWISALIAALFILIIAIPAIDEWFSQAYNVFSSSILDYSKSVTIDYDRFIDSANSSKYIMPVLYLMVMILAGMAAYIWREFKSVIQ